MVFLLVALSVAASTAAASPTLSVDLDGDGSAETVTAVPARRGVRIEVRSGAGKKLATVDAPSPRSDGSPVISLSPGSLGKSGSLLEVVAATETEECRSVWRLAKGALVRVPVATGETPAPDCGPAREWTSSWDPASSTSVPDGAAIYRRERSRETPNGRLHQIEWFRYTTFRLERDPERSSAEIGGVTIPNWSPVYMYPKPALEILYARFGLEPFKTGPRLRWRADMSTGAFRLEVERAGRTESFDVAAFGPGEQRNDYLVRVRFAEGERQVRTSLIGKSDIPYETVLSGVRPDLDGLYTPPVHLLENGLQVFRSAEEEIASNSLAGTWAGRKGEVIKFTFRPGETRVLIGEHAYLLDIRSAPSGLDLVAVSGDGGPPVGFRLLGPNALERAPIRCDSGGSGFNGCRVSGAAERFHRVGARLNTR